MVLCSTWIMNMTWISRWIIFESTKHDSKFQNIRSNKNLTKVLSSLLFSRFHQTLQFVRRVIYLLISNNGNVNIPIWTMNQISSGIAHSKEGTFGIRMHYLKHNCWRHAWKTYFSKIKMYKPNTVQNIYWSRKW